MVKKKKVKAKAKRPVARRKARKAKPAARKSVAKKTVRKARKAKGLPEAALEKVGEVTHYFPHVKAAAILVLKDGLKVGDEVYIKGHTTDFKEKIISIQLDHAQIQESKKGQEIGLLVSSRVRTGDNVYKI